MIDKNYCMSSYLAFRYIERDDVELYPGFRHHNFVPVPERERIPVRTAEEIDRELRKQIQRFEPLHKGVLLSGGMDQLLSRDWSFDEFVERYTFTRPESVLKQPVDVSGLYERYRKDGGGIDYLSFRDDLDMSGFTGNQKWQMYCLERFLDMCEGTKTTG